MLWDRIKLKHLSTYYATDSIVCVILFQKAFDSNRHSVLGCTRRVVKIQMLNVVKSVRADKVFIHVYNCFVTHPAG